MVEQLHRRRVLRYLEASYAGDIDAALACCTDDVTTLAYLPVELFPHLGPRQGKAAIAELLRHQAARYSKRGFEITFLTASADGAAAILEVSLTKRTDGRVIRLTAGNFFSFRHGLIAGMRSFLDTVDAIEQLTGRDVVNMLKTETGLAQHLAEAPTKERT